MMLGNIFDVATILFIVVIAIIVNLFAGRYFDRKAEKLATTQIHSFQEPQEGECENCQHITECVNPASGGWLCPSCDGQPAWDESEDRRLDSPIHRQAKWINRERI